MCRLQDDYHPITSALWVICVSVLADVAQMVLFETAVYSMSESLHLQPGSTQVDAVYFAGCLVHGPAGQSPSTCG